MTEKWELEDYKAPVDWEAVGPDLLAALENAVANAEEALDFMDCRPKYDHHPLKPLLHTIRMPARAAIAKARGQS